MVTELGRQVRHAARCVALLIVAAPACAGEPPPELTAPAAPTTALGGTLVVLGDTQRTTWPELLIGRENNESARRALIDKLAREERPALLVHLGDLVGWGSSSSEWEYFDGLMSALTSQGTPIHPVLGNHDYWGLDVLALQNARRRFPELAPLTYRTLRYRDLGLVLVDSNLGGTQAAEQASWFEAALAGFEQDASVAGVLVFTHHPPFTNGRAREDDPYVGRALLPAFFRATKTVAMLSGHVHGYERFEVSGKAFVVSAGGGGPRVEYKVGRDAPHPAAYVAPDAGRRAFHYVVIDPEAGGLRFTVKCLELDAPCSAGQLETFVLPLPAPRP